MVRVAALLGIVWVSLSPAGVAWADPPADPIGHWAFDAGSGSVAVDDSGNGYDAVISGGASWVAGLYGMALQFDGQDGYVNTEQPLLNDLAGFTMAGWISMASSNVYAGIFGQNELIEFGMTTENGGQIGTWMAGNDWAFVGADYPYAYPSWHHVVLAGDADRVVIFIDGQEVASDENGMVSGTSTFPFSIGDYVFNTWNDPFEGEIDDVWLYGRRLSAEEILAVMAGPGGGERASAPYPTDKALDIPRDITLTWTPGAFAVEHDVYLGTDAVAVEGASRTDPMGVLVSQGQADASYALDAAFEFGQTYYWRIDEVNGAPDRTIHTGNVWSCTVEPFAYQIQGVIATSNATSSADQGPENTVNGSGLDENDQHSVNKNDMWTATPSGDDPIHIQFEFDRVYKLYEVLVWNYNMDFEWFIGVGLKDVTVEYSVDSVDWTSLGDIQLTRGPGTEGYAANTTITFDGVPAQYVRFTVISSYGTTDNYGLSEVRFTYLPAHPREPEPADGAADVSVGTSLSWRAGREAVAHEVYLGTEAQAMERAATTTESLYTPASLDLNTTYFWQVIEVNEAEAISAWAGDVWSFSTQACLEIDGFEGYNDDEEAGTTIWQTWVDGIEDESNGGSQAGHYESPFAEHTIVLTGNQSMPLYYANETADAISEIDRIFDSPQDWTAHGIKTLSLWLYGTEGNTGQLHAAINGVKVFFPGDLTRIGWYPWNIDLTAVNTNLSNVTILSLGFEGVASGLIYIDDIRLYSQDAESVNLVGYYPLDGDATDSSGFGHDGLTYGDPVYGMGVDGQAVNLDGVDDYVVIVDTGVEARHPRTIAGWAKADTTDVTEWTGVFGFTGPAGDNGHFDIECVGDTDNTTLGYYGLHRYGWERDIIPIDLEWHHLAATYDGVTVRWYGDAQLIGSEEIDAANIAPPGQVHIGRRQDNTAYFGGLVDDVQLYDRALSAEELAGL